MATVTASLARRIATSGNLDLKTSLAIRVVAVALLCFLVTAALALFGTYRDVRQANERLADIISRQLQVQFFRIDAGLEAPARFPILEPAIDGVLGAGQCIRFLKPDGSLERSNCVGVSQGDATPPAWFLALAAGVLAGRADVERAVVYRGKTHGTLLVTTATEKLFTYALGRPVHYDDMPAVRSIVRESARQNYRFSSLIMGVVRSTAFQKRIKPEL